MVHLTADILNPQTAVDAVMTTSDGAYVQFVGMVRSHSRGRQVTGLEYQAYAPMAERQMGVLVSAVREKWGLACAILHRTGYIPVGEAAVVVCVASSHRAEAFEACRWVIDTLKKDVPIWKKEFTADGTYWIEGEDAISTEK
jgi:molybdopterin synthase catalytic subunit